MQQNGKLQEQNLLIKCARRLYDDFDPILSCNIIDVYGLR